MNNLIEPSPIWWEMENLVWEVLDLATNKVLWNHLSWKGEFCFFGNGTIKDLSFDRSIVCLLLMVAEFKILLWSDVNFENKWSCFVVSNLRKWVNRFRSQIFLRKWYIVASYEGNSGHQFLFWKRKKPECATSWKFLT